MCIFTWSLLGFNQPIPMLVLLSCHYRGSVQVSLQEQETRQSLKVRDRAQELSCSPQVRVGVGSSTSIFLRMAWGPGDAENPAAGSCRVREKEICFLCLFSSEVGAHFASPEHSCPATAAHLPLQPYTLLFWGQALQICTEI